METNFNKLIDLYTDKENIFKYVKLKKKLPPPFFLINELPFHFDKTAKKIGISFSGGADSTLLLYILAKLIKENNLDCKIHPITAIRFFETKPWLEYISVEVLNYLKNMFPNIIENQLWTFIPTEFELIKISSLNHEKYNNLHNANTASCDVIIMGENLKYFSKRYNLKWIYTGITLNPPIEIDSSPKFRDQEMNLNLKYEHIVSTYNNEISPFRYISKDWIIAQYFNFNLEELLNLTRSCQVDMIDLNLKTWSVGDPYPGECGKCFFCIEKQWAKQNMKIYLKENTNV